MSTKGQTRASSSAPVKKSAELRPSSSILLLSPTNQALLLHRVQASTSFASAHVFPGGNLSSFHEGPLQPEDTFKDCKAFRLAALRETFEESGILLAKPGSEAALANTPQDVLEEGRKQVHANKIKFTDFLASINVVPDLDGLIPFTRWVTPVGLYTSKRFNTQMYLYLLPLSTSLPGVSSSQQQQTIIHTPTHDGGLEHTAASFDNPATWLSKSRSGEITLYPPQFYLLTLVSQFLHPPSPETTPTTKHFQSQRDKLLQFLNQVPTGEEGHATAQIPWAEKVMSPTSLFMRKGDKRVVLGLDKPGPELKGSGRGGDWDRVVLVRFEKGIPGMVEVRRRREVLAEEREGDGKAEREGAKL